MNEQQPKRECESKPQGVNSNSWSVCNVFLLVYVQDCEPSPSILLQNTSSPATLSVCDLTYLWECMGGVLPCWCSDNSHALKLKEQTPELEDRAFWLWAAWECVWTGTGYSDPGCVCRTARQSAPSQLQQGGCSRLTWTNRLNKMILNESYFDLKSFLSAALLQSPELGSLSEKVTIHEETSIFSSPPPVPDTEQRIWPHVSSLITPISVTTLVAVKSPHWLMAEGLDKHERQLSQEILCSGPTPEFGSLLSLPLTARET